MSFEVELFYWVGYIVIMLGLFSLALYIGAWAWQKLFSWKVACKVGGILTRFKYRYPKKWKELVGNDEVSE